MNDKIKVTEILEIKIYGRIPTTIWTYHIAKTENSGWCAYDDGYKLWNNGDEIFIPKEKIISINKLYRIEREN